MSDALSQEALAATRLSAAEIRDLGSHVKTLATLLQLPVPLVVALFFAMRSAANGTTAGGAATAAAPPAAPPAFWGISTPPEFAVFLIMCFNGLILLNAARITSLIHAAWRRAPNDERVLGAITGNTALLNPFSRRSAPLKQAGPAYNLFDVVPNGFLDVVPTLTVGLILGFVLLTILPASAPRMVAWLPYWNAAVWFTVLLHMVGCVALYNRLYVALKAILGRLRVALFVAGCIGGASIGYLITSSFAAR